MAAERFEEQKRDSDEHAALLRQVLLSSETPARTEVAELAGEEDRVEQPSARE